MKRLVITELNQATIETKTIFEQDFPNVGSFDITGGCEKESKEFSESGYTLTVKLKKKIWSIMTSHDCIHVFILTGKRTKKIKFTM